MEVGAGLVAGSHNRNELVVIPRDGDLAPRQLERLSGQVCQICGDDVGLNVDGELFVACNECAFPICRICYEYERCEGSQVCPQCKTRFKRLKGCARVAGDEDEDDVDDLENEFNFPGMDKHDMKHSSDFMLHGHMSYGRAGDVELPQVVNTSQVPLLTNGQMVDDIPPEHHALVPSYVGDWGKRVYPLPSVDAGTPVQPRPLDPSKDLTAYGYGSIAWKERMEIWKQRQDKLQLMKSEDRGNDWGNDADGPDLPL